MISHNVSKELVKRLQLKIAIVRKSGLKSPHEESTRSPAANNSRQYQSGDGRLATLHRRQTSYFSNRSLRPENGRNTSSMTELNKQFS